MSEKEYKAKCQALFKKNTILINENQMLKNQNNMLTCFCDDCKKIENLQKENNSIKQILINLVTAFNNYECAGPEQEQENTWETLRDLMHEELLKIENGAIAE